MSEAALLPALESVFRAVPAAGPPHAAAAELLGELLPALLAARPINCGADAAACAAAADDLDRQVAGALTTLRKFAQRFGAGSATGAGPAADADAGGAVALQMLGALSSALAGAEVAALEAGGAGAVEAPLVTFAAAQLLPGTQVRLRLMGIVERAVAIGFLFPAFCIRHDRVRYLADCTINT